MAKHTLELDDIQEQALTARARGGTLSNTAILQLIVERGLLEYVQRVQKLDDEKIVRIVKSDTFLWNLVKDHADV